MGSSWSIRLCSVAKRSSRPWKRRAPSAAACVTLHRQTGDRVFEEGIRRWAEIIRCSPPADRASAYAEQYGRCITFLARVARALGERRYVTLARRLADEAVVRLPENGWFQGSPDSHLYEAVDGIGYLFLALLELETGESAAGWGGEF